jgi:KDO2-lipid IV(A) lauroyltransferase
MRAWKHTRAARTLRRAGHLAEYAGFLLVLALARAVPRRTLLWTGERIGDLLWLIRLRRRIIDRNLELVGRWPKEARQPLVHRLYRTMGRYGVDLLRTASVRPPLTPDSEAALTQLAASPRGTVVCFAHFGNWELLLTVLATAMGRLSFIVKPMNNPLVDRWLTALRRQCGLELAPPGNAFREALRVLNRGGAIAFAVDQWPGEMGSPCPFLGVTTRTVRTVAGLAHMTGCRTLAGYAVLEPDGRYRIVLTELPLPADLPADRTAAVSVLQEQHNALISNWIREQPEQWFGWLHRRFKDATLYSARPRRRRTRALHHARVIGHCRPKAACYTERRK